MNELWQFLEAVSQTPRFTLIAGVASIFGLVFSWLAWRRAGRASQAAREARDAVTIRSLVDEFQLACANTDQLLDFLTHDRLPEARLRAHELTSVLSEIPHRRSPYLTEKRKSELRNVRRNARFMTEVLTSGQQTALTPEQKQRLIRQCQKISITLRENLGTIKGEIDTGVKQ
jgi:hypothetical protein